MPRKKITHIGRKTRCAKKMAKRRANETPEQRKKSREICRLKQAARRAAETAEQRENRLLMCRIRVASKRARQRSSLKKQRLPEVIHCGSQRRKRPHFELMCQPLVATSNLSLSDFPGNISTKQYIDNTKLFKRSSFLHSIDVFSHDVNEGSSEMGNADFKCSSSPLKYTGSIKKIYVTDKVDIFTHGVNKKSSTEPNNFNYHGSHFNYSFRERNINYKETSKNTIYLSSTHSLINTDEKYCDEAHKTLVIKQDFCESNSNQQNICDVDGNINPFFPICELVESTEVITPD